MIELSTIEETAPIEINSTGYQTLLIRQIRRDGGTQARVGLHEDTVQEYAELMREQAWDFRSFQRPIVLYDGKAFWLADGFHRIEAAQRAGLSDYPVEVQQGTKRDAILRAAGANSQHGLRRTNADKRRAVELLLKDEEWRQWSDRKIADVCAVSDKTVGAIRRDLSAEFPQIQTRTVERNGTTYQMTPRPTVADRTDNAPIGTPNLLPADLVAAGVQFIPHGAWFRITGPFDLNDWAQRAQPFEQAVSTARTLIAQTQKPNISEVAPATPVEESDHPLMIDSLSDVQLAAPAPAETDDQALLAQIREKAAGYGLQLIVEDGKAIVYWNGEDVELMEALPYPIVLEWLDNEAEGAWERYKAAQGAPTLATLDRTLPKDLEAAGYFWQSDTPPTIAHNTGNWRGDAQTAEKAIELAYDREKGRAVADRRLPAPIYVKVMDLIGKLSKAVVDAENQQAAKTARAIAILIEQEIAT